MLALVKDVDSHFISFLLFITFVRPNHFSISAHVFSCDTCISHYIRFNSIEWVIFFFNATIINEISFTYKNTIKTSTATRRCNMLIVLQVWTFTPLCSFKIFFDMVLMRLIRYELFKLHISMRKFVSAFSCSDNMQCIETIVNEHNFLHKKNKIKPLLLLLNSL